MKYGTEEQKAYSGAASCAKRPFAIGYSEPEAGTDPPPCAPGRTRRGHSG